MKTAFDPVARALARRERHRRRPLVVRGLSVIVGGVLLVLGTLMMWFPEVGLPIAAAGLGLLALEYDWAARWLGWLVAKWEAARRWWTRLGPRRKVSLVAAGVAIGVLAILPFL